MGRTAFLLLFIALTAVLVWLTLKAWRSPRAAIKWPLGILGTLFSLIFLLITVLGGKGVMTLGATSDRIAPDFKVQILPERVARGAEIANWCAGCHSMTKALPLSGGKNLSDEAGMPFGDLYPINLTPAGPLKDWTDGQIFRAIRHGVDEKGKRLPVMSSQAVGFLSDDDIQSVIAYLRTQPPVENVTPPPNPSFLAAVMSGAGMLPKRPREVADMIVAPLRGPTPAYGEYMATWMGCEECHGPNLAGGNPKGFLPVGPNLRSVKNWTAEGFITAMRTGKTPFGKQLDTLLMPWQPLGKFPDADLIALHAYLQGLQ
jgi:mono/diheme cytochrome c family protein